MTKQNRLTASASFLKYKRYQKVESQDIFSVQIEIILVFGVEIRLPMQMLITYDRAC